MNIQEFFLKLAQIEEDAGVLYKRFSEKCGEKLKPAMIAFSEEEKNHNKILLELSSDNHLKEKEIGEDIEKDIQNQTDYLINNSNTLDLTSEKDFFRFALQLEKDSVKIYTQLLSIFEINSYGYESFEWLINEEKKHMLYILNKLYELK